MKKGKCFKLLIDEMKNTAEECKTSPILDEHAWDLLEAIKKTEETSTALLQVAGEGHTRRFLANAYLYYEMLGHVVIAWIWLKQAKVAAHARERSSEADRNFYEGKLRACQYFFKWELPKIQALSQLLISVDTTCLDMPIDCF